MKYNNITQHYLIDLTLGPVFYDAQRDKSDKDSILLYKNGVVYPTYFPIAQLYEEKYPLDRLLTNPSFMDSIYQACAAYLLASKKRVYLPWAVGELGIVDPPREDGQFATHVMRVKDDDDISTFKVVMVDDKNRVRYFARNVQFRRINL